MALSLPETRQSRADQGGGRRQRRVAGLKSKRAPRRSSIGRAARQFRQRPSPPHRGDGGRVKRRRAERQARRPGSRRAAVRQPCIGGCEFPRSIPNGPRSKSFGGLCSFRAHSQRRGRRAPGRRTPVSSLVAGWPATKRRALACVRAVDQPRYVKRRDCWARRGRVAGGECARSRRRRGRSSAAAINEPVRSAELLGFAGASAPRRGPSSTPPPRQRA